MNESQYYDGEITDSELDAMADAGLFYLDEIGFFFTPTKAEIDSMVSDGEGQ